jgi:hypothetical protein
LVLSIAVPKAIKGRRTEKQICRSVTFALLPGKHELYICEETDRPQFYSVENYGLAIMRLTQVLKESRLGPYTYIDEIEHNELLCPCATETFTW